MRQKLFLPIFVLSLSLACPLASHAARAHQDVWLRNEAGEHITPSLNSSDAYSPRRTCGGCHSYGTVTRGGHFQQGFDQAPPKKGTASGLYWKGLDLCAFPEPVAPKSIRDSRLAGLSAYDWPAAAAGLNTAKKVSFPAAGWYMPGGGPLEYGRDRAGRPDFAASLAQREASGRSRTDGDYSSRFTPDRLSHFRESGVIEADCLICHSRSYSMDARNAQLNARNYRWAATAGAGIGRVRGAVFSPANPAAVPGDPDFLSGKWNFSSRPVVSYRWKDGRLFAPEGRLKGSALRTGVASANCLLCHGELDAARTGTTHDKKSDVHAAAGLQCTDCHGLAGKTKKDRLLHRMAGERTGDKTAGHVRTCEECHSPGGKKLPGIAARASDPRKTHAGRFPRNVFHFHVISCTGCHAVSQGARGAYLVDRSSGVQSWYTADALEKVTGPESLAQAAPRPWRPWILVHDSMYAAGVSRPAQWFGADDGGAVRPLRLDFVEKTLRTVRLTQAAVKGPDGKTVKVRTVAGEGEIKEALAALGSAGIHNPVFVSDRAYRLEKGKLTAAQGPAGLERFIINHEISSKKNALGAKGCRDCHADSAAFFTKPRVANIGGFLKGYPELKDPYAFPQMREWGLSAVPPMMKR
jgi:hypothetical protein